MIRILIPRKKFKKQNQISWVPLIHKMIRVLILRKNFSIQNQIWSLSLIYKTKSRFGFFSSIFLYRRTQDSKWFLKTRFSHPWLSWSSVLSNSLGPVHDFATRTIMHRAQSTSEITHRLIYLGVSSFINLRAVRLNPAVQNFTSGIIERREKEDWLV